MDTSIARMFCNAPRSASWLRASAWLGLACVLCIGVPAAAQDAARQPTGTQVLAELANAQQAVESRAATAPDDATGLQAVATKLQGMGSALRAALGDDADQPITDIGSDERAAAVRAGSAARRVQAWLAASAAGCTRDDIEAMLKALTATLDKLAADTTSQGAPLPMIDGVTTLDGRPLFVLREGAESTRLVLTGANLIDPGCPGPVVTALDAQGQPVGPQPQVAAAHPDRVELDWAGVGKLPPGGYTLQLTTERKAFLHCASQPPTNAMVEVAPPLRFSVTYVLIATCAGSTAPVSLGAATLTLAGRGQTEARDIDVKACPQPVSYTVTAAVRDAGGFETKMSPVTHPADAAIDADLGNGLTLDWDPAGHRLSVNSGGRTCKGVY
ncbi:MAG TPA: hypothetical protein VFY97_01285 [Rhodanobacteraceae bacterium]|nr:hypothetical protein [Rhodanobacteraceae bacterium]